MELTLAQAIETGNVVYRDFDKGTRRVVVTPQPNGRVLVEHQVFHVAYDGTVEMRDTFSFDYSSKLYAYKALRRYGWNIDGDWYIA